MGLFDSIKAATEKLDTNKIKAHIETAKEYAEITKETISFFKKVAGIAK